MQDFERNFDNEAVCYENSRPAYAEPLYADLLQYQPLHSRSTVLEIGLGSGKATLPILQTNCRLVGLEPGAKLAALAAQKFSGWENFDLQVTTLQDYVCPPETFDLIYSATAFHWIPEEYGYRRVHSLLKSGGAFARFAYHAGPDRSRQALSEEIQALYRQCFSNPSTPREYSKADAEQLAARAEQYGFVCTASHLYHTTRDFTPEGYLELLTTYPNHMALPVPDRIRLFEGIRSAIIRHGGTITVYYTMDLELARKP